MKWSMLSGRRIFMQLTRRSFLKVAGVAAVTLPMSDSQSSEKSADGLPRRVLGKTNEPVTILGLGGAWLAYDKAAHDHKATEARTRAMIEAALEGGIRYFDTAPNYFL